MSTVKPEPTVTIELALFEQLQKKAIATDRELERMATERARGIIPHREDPAYKWAIDAALAHKPKPKYEPAPMPKDEDIDAVLARIKKAKPKRRRKR
jgi:hypothetical protein